MLLEYKFDLRCNSLIYERTFLKALKKFNLEGKLFKESNLLYCYAKIDDNIEKFIDYFASILPSTIFLYDMEVQTKENYPRAKFSKLKEIQVNEDKIEVAPCIECSNAIINKDDKDYFNIFKSCEVCGYGIDGEHRSYENEIEKIAKEIIDNKKVNLNLFYGNWTLSKVNDNSKNIVVYDIATLQKYTSITDDEITAIASIEKPLLTLSTRLNFRIDYKCDNLELTDFKLPDDTILQLLMHKLHSLGVDAISISKDKEYDSEYKLVNFKKELEPIKVVASKNHKSVISGNKGIECKSSKGATPIETIKNIIDENSISKPNIAGAYLSKDNTSYIYVIGEKYGVVEYLKIDFNYNTIGDIIEDIKNSEEVANKLISNYNKKFEGHLESIKDIKLKENMSIYDLWGAVAIVAKICNTKELSEASNIINENSIKFLGYRGPKIDYVLTKENEKAKLDPLKIFRSVISFKLAGVDDLTLSYGIIECFCEFINNEIDAIQTSMQAEAVVVTGNLLENKKIYQKLSEDISTNHEIYMPRYL